VERGEDEERGEWAGVAVFEGWGIVDGEFEGGVGLGLGCGRQI
jgi:hypothetical protein